MRRYTSDEFRRFLEATDRRLSQGASLTIIGGCAGALAYGVQSASRDIDAYDTDMGPLAAALDAAREITGLDIPVCPTPVATLPDDYAKRRRRVLQDLSQLSVFVPDPYDLILSKIVRGQQNDIEMSLEVASSQALLLDRFIERYLDEMQATIAHPGLQDAAFLGFIDQQYGSKASKSTERRIKARRREREIALGLSKTDH
jgi:hypothetical protein